MFFLETRDLDTPCNELRLASAQDDLGFIRIGLQTRGCMEDVQGLFDRLERAVMSFAEDEDIVCKKEMGQLELLAMRVEFKTFLCASMEH